MKHENIGRCPRCEDKLKSAHPLLVTWFYWLKESFHHAHIAWSFRDQKDQDDAFDHGLSKVKWPNSKHNAVDENGRPCSKALDLFELDNDGKANFFDHWYEKINEANIAADMPIRWGGTFKTFKDKDHFELIEGH